MERIRRAARTNHERWLRQRIDALLPGYRPPAQEWAGCPCHLRTKLRPLEPRQALASAFRPVGRHSDGLNERHCAASAGAGAPAAEVVAYFTAHHVSLEIESVNLSVGMVLLLMFAASLHARIGTSVSLTALAAATAIAACTLVEVAAFQALVYRPNPDALRATLLNDFQDFGFLVTTFPALLFLASSSYGIVTTGALPRILGQAAAIAAGLQVVAWISFFAPVGTARRRRHSHHHRLCRPHPLDRRLLRDDGGQAGARCRGMKEQPRSRLPRGCCRYAGCAFVIRRPPSGR